MRRSRRPVAVAPGTATPLEANARGQRTVTARRPRDHNPVGVFVIFGNFVITTQWLLRDLRDLRDLRAGAVDPSQSLVVPPLRSKRTHADNER